MRTIFIRGTDIVGIPADAFEKPITDGGLKFDRADPLSMLNEVYEMAGIAGIDGIAIGLRGNRDAGYPHWPVFRAAFESYTGPFVRTAPTLMPFVDTGALRDIVTYDSQGVMYPFDFLNDDHLRVFWELHLKPFYDVFIEGRAVPNPIRYERTPEGRPVILLWSIDFATGFVTNQVYAQHLLNYVRGQMEDAGLGTPAFIVDGSWEKAPDLNVYGVHQWFAPWAQEAYSVYTYGDVTTGIAVPAFNIKSQPTWTIPRLNGQTLRVALEAMRVAKADYVFLESFNNMIESAGFYRSDAWQPRELYLNIVREHMELTAPIPEPVYGESMVALTDLGESKLYDDLLPGSEPGTFALIYPTPGGNTVFSLQPDGSIQTRPKTTIGPWESGKKKDGKLVFRTHGAVKVFGLVEGV